MSGQQSRHVGMKGLKMFLLHCSFSGFLYVIFFPFWMIFLFCCWRFDIRMNMQKKGKWKDWKTWFCLFVMQFLWVSLHKKGFPFSDLIVQHQNKHLVNCHLFGLLGFFSSQHQQRNNTNCGHLLLPLVRLQLVNVVFSCKNLHNKMLGFLATVLLSLMSLGQNCGISPRKFTIGHHFKLTGQLNSIACRQFVHWWW